MTDSRCGLSKTVLHSADFEDSVLNRTTFINADLRHANLLNCELVGCDFTDADLIDTILPDGKVFRESAEGINHLMSLNIKDSKA